MASVKPVRLVIFDLDGTLVDAYPAVTRSVNNTLAALGFPRRSPQEVRRAVGWGDRTLLAQFVGEGKADRALRLYRPDHARALAAPGGVKFLKGSRALLTALKKDGYLLAIASNRPTRFTRLILKVLEAAPFFDMVLCADRLKRGKPDPAILLAILNKLRVTRPEALYVGDMTIDVNTGRRARVRTAAVTTGSSTPEELKRLNPFGIINTIGQVQGVLEALNNTAGRSRETS